MIHTLALSTFLGLPLVVYGGIATFLLLLSTASLGFIFYKKIPTKIPFKFHPALAATTIVVAMIHALFGLSIFLGF